MRLNNISKYFILIWLSCSVSFGESQTIAGMKMNADKVDFDYETNESSFSGNVIISKGKMILKSDKAKISMSDKKAKASGDVNILNDNRVFFCDKINYDFKNKDGVMINAQTYEGPFIIKGSEARETENNMIEIDDASIFACHNTNPHFRITAKQIILLPNNKIISKHAVFWLGPIPVFYWPYYKRDLSEHSIFSFRVMQNDILGFAFLTKYKFFAGEHVIAKALVDYYEKRGLGIGIESKILYDKSTTKVESYFIDDSEFDPNRSEDEAGNQGRYHVHLTNSSSFSNKTTAKLNMTYYSDLDFYDDFFPDKFDQDIQPDNRLRINHSSEGSSLGMNLRLKLNDFHNVLERLPEFYFDLHQTSLGETNFYFLSSNRLAYLNQDFNTSDNTHDTTRFYSRNLITYAKKYFGWLSISPQIQLDTIWYSTSRKTSTYDVETEVLNSETEELEIITTTSILEEEASSLLRVAPSFSLSFSTSLFKVFQSDSNMFDFNKYRHILTPSISYVYTPKSNEDNENIFQFDEIDNRASEMQSSINFNLISRWQIKKGNNSETVLNDRLSISYDLEADEDPISNLNYDSEIRFFRNFKMDARTSYDVEDGEIDYVRDDFSWQVSNVFGLSLAYWYRKNDDDIITPELSVNFSNNLFLRAYGFYNDETGIFEKTTFSLIKSMHCLDFALTYSEREFRDEKTIYFSISPRNHSAQGLTFEEI